MFGVNDELIDQAECRGFRGGLIYGVFWPIAIPVSCIAFVCLKLSDWSTKRAWKREEERRRTERAVAQAMAPKPDTGPHLVSFAEHRKTRKGN
jgi:hypothetical protein